MSEEESSIASEVLSASLGGAISASILYPLEVLKTQMQACDANDGGSSSHEDRCPRSMSMLEFAKKLYQQDPMVFVRGVETSGFQSALEKALYFLAYTYFKRSYLKITNQTQLHTFPNLVLGCAAEWAHLPLSLPVDAWTTRIQTQSSSSATSGGSTNKTHQAPLQILLHMLNDQDCRFYSGISAYSLLCLKPALQYTVYEQVKALVVKGRSTKSLSAAEAFVLGMVARTISTVLVFPFIRAKVLMQTSKKNSAKKEQVTTGSSTDGDSNNNNNNTEATATTPKKKEQQERVITLVWDLWCRNGLSGLYQGLGPELTRGVLSSALMLMIKERISVLVQQLMAAKSSSSSSNPHGRNRHRRVTYGS